MAPMIDMVFLLLVFFMTVSTLAQEELVELELPESERSHVPDERAGRGTVSLRWAEDGSVELFVGAQPVDMEEMRERLKAALAERPGLEVNLRAEADMPFGEIRKVLTACAEVGAVEVIYATFQAR